MSDEKEYKSVTAAEFRRILKGEVEEYVWDKIKLARIGYSGLDEAVIIHSIRVKERAVLLNNDELGNDVIYSLPIIFHSGIFESECRIEGGIFKKIFWIDGGDFRNGFHILRGTFQNNVRIYGGVFKNDFIISQPTFQRDFVILEGIFKNDIVIFGGDYWGEVSIANGNFERNVTILNGTFRKDFVIRGGIFKETFQISNGSFENCFRVYGGTFETRFWISGGNFEKQFLITNGKFLQWCLISGGKFKLLQLFFVNLKMNYLWLGENFEAKAIEIHSHDIEASYELKHLLVLHATLMQGMILKVRNILVNNIFISSFLNLSNVIMSGVGFKEAEKYELSELSEEEIRKEIFDPLLPAVDAFQIYNSDLGKTTMIDCDFSGMQLDFQSSKITEVFLAGTKMPEKIITADDEQKQLGYAQLKKINENRGYQIAAHDYYSKEMNAYWATLKKKKKTFRGWFGTFGERFNVSLNWFSTNHGASWIRGLGSTSLVSIFLYCLYCSSLGYTPTLQWNTETWNNFFYCFGLFFYFIIPIHKTDFFSSGQLSNWTNVIDGSSRIATAFFIYQLIQAFRKHGKK